MNILQTRHARIARKIELSSILHIGALAAVALTIFQLVFPFLEPGFRNGHDLFAHVTHTYLFDRAFQQGQFPVRWNESLQNGGGQPLFNFYQVGFYYLVELVHRVVPRLSRSLTVTVVLCWWIAAGFMYLLFKRFGSLPAAFAVVTFALSPYLVQDVFIRAAYPEVAAIAFAVGVLWALDRFLTTGRIVFLPALAILVFMTLICHLPATVIMAPLLGAYMTYLLFTKQTTTRRLLLTLPACVIGAGMAAFYVLPALAEIEHVNIASLTTGFFDYHHNFVDPKEWDGMPRRGQSMELTLQFALSQWGVLGAAGLQIVLAAARKRHRDQMAGIILWLGLAGVALFMMTAASVKVWEMVPPLSFIQFPFRFFIIFSIACAALGAILLSSIKSRSVQALIVIATLGAHLQIYHRYQWPERLIPLEELNIDDTRWRGTAKAARNAFLDLGYNPVGINDPAAPGIGRSTITQGYGTIREASTQDAKLVLDVQTEAGMRVTINTPYFPGWVVRVDGHDTVVATRPKDGYMNLLVPPGAHRIEAEFRNTPVRTWANIISLVSLALLGMSLGAVALVRTRSL